MKKLLPLFAAALLCAGCAAASAPEATIRPFFTPAAPAAAEAAEAEATKTPLPAATPEATALPEKGLVSDKWFTLAEDGVFYGDTFCFILPAGWVEAEGVAPSGTYVFFKKDSADGGAVTLELTEGGGRETFTAEAYARAVEKQVKDSGEEATCKVLGQEDFHVDGRQAISLVCLVDREEDPCTLYGYVFFEEGRRIFITCSDPTGKWKKEFSEIGGTLSFYE
ncbi:MAG: hypothetical protein ACOX17_01270 [Christensenellales bacterium]|jgi:hypothetical protein